jgi:hypothetical protein
MYDVNGLGPGFGGTLAAPIWHDYMAQASNGYCSDFTQPTTPFSGTAFFGKFATTGSSSGNGNGNGNGSYQTNSGGAPTSPYNNPSLYAHPPQPASPAPGAGHGHGNGAGNGNGNGNGNKPPSGFGGGHGATTTTGGTGVGHH